MTARKEGGREVNNEDCGGKTDTDRGHNMEGENREWKIKEEEERK